MSPFSHPVASIAVLLVLAGGTASGLALAEQQHAPMPAASAAGSSGSALGEPAHAAHPARAGGPRQPAGPAPSPATGPVMAASTPVSITIPAIGVHSQLLVLGVNPDHTIQVPPLNDSPETNEAAWFKYSATPGAVGASLIEGHIDSAAQGPSVFFRLGALRPGDDVVVRLADGQSGVFAVSGVREYSKSAFPTSLVFQNPGYAALRLVTCGGAFDDQTHHYESNIVVFARLVSTQPAAAA